MQVTLGTRGRLLIEGKSRLRACTGRRATQRRSIASTLQDAFGRRRGRQCRRGRALRRPPTNQHHLKPMPPTRGVGNRAVRRRPHRLSRPQWSCQRSSMRYSSRNSRSRGRGGSRGRSSSNNCCSFGRSPVVAPTSILPTPALAASRCRVGSRRRRGRRARLRRRGRLRIGRRCSPTVMCG